MPAVGPGPSWMRASARCYDRQRSADGGPAARTQDRGRDLGAAAYEPGRRIRDRAYGRADARSALTPRLTADDLGAVLDPSSGWPSRPPDGRGTTTGDLRPPFHLRRERWRASDDARTARATCGETGQDARGCSRRCCALRSRQDRRSGVSDHEAREAVATPALPGSGRELRRG